LLSCEDVGCKDWFWLEKSWLICVNSSDEVRLVEYSRCVAAVRLLRSGRILVSSILSLIVHLLLLEKWISLLLSHLLVDVIYEQFVLLLSGDVLVVLHVCKFTSKCKGFALILGFN